jgi:hypothetical protein
MYKKNKKIKKRKSLQSNLLWILNIDPYAKIICVKVKTNFRATGIVFSTIGVPTANIKYYSYDSEGQNT